MRSRCVSLGVDLDSDQSKRTNLIVVRIQRKKLIFYSITLSSQSKHVLAGLFWAYMNRVRYIAKLTRSAEDKMVRE